MSKFYDALRAAGHTLQLDERGEVDNWAYSFAYCNGPACVSCGDCWCEHGACAGTIRPCDKPVIEAEFTDVTEQCALERVPAVADNRDGAAS